MDKVFVGRRAELESLREQLERAASGCASVALVEGVGGAGKSALLDQLATQATKANGADGADGARMLRVCGDAEETGIAYAVYDQLLTAVDRSSTAAAKPSQQSAGVRPVRTGDLQATGEQLHAELLRLSSRQRLTVLMVDDAHLADRSSLAAISFAVRRLQNEPVCTVLATRPEGAERIPAGLVKLVDVSGRRVQLGGLDASDIREMAARYGRGSISDRAARRLEEHTSGSPLHLRALFSDRRLDHQDLLAAPLPAPRRFAQLVTSQAAQLSAEARELARASAVLGARSDLAKAAQMARLADPWAAADELQRSAFVRLVRSADLTELEFEHALIRSALIEECGPAKLACLHRDAAEVTEGSEALFHLAAATTGPAPGLSVRLCEQAAADIARGSWRTAANAFLEAARLANGSVQGDAALVHGAYALLVAGDLAVARSYRDRIAALRESALAAQVLALMAWQAGEFAEAGAVAVRGWTLANDLEPRERDRMAGLIAQMYIWQGRSAEAIDWSESALHSGLLDPDARSMTLATLVGSMGMHGRAVEALRLLPTDGDLADAGYRELVGMRGIIEMLSDDPAGATEKMRIRLRPNLADHRHGPAPAAVLTATGPDGIEPNKLMVLLFLADAEFRQGHWDVSAALAEQVIALTEDTEQYWIAPWAHAAAAMVPASRGEWSTAEAHRECAERGAADLGGEFNRLYAGNAAAHLAACRGDVARVVAAAEQLQSIGTPVRDEPGLYCWPVHHADALVAQRRYDEAEAVIGEWVPICERLGRRSRIAAWWRVRGDLATQRRDVAGARAAYATALEIGDDRSDMLGRALLFAGRGRFLRRRGERRAAIQDLREAESRFAQLGAEPFLVRVRSELAACGLAVGLRSDEPDQVGSLTPQENAVARLVASGCTNREIADALVLSQKTVAYHLGHVYTKLGVRSRAELAARHTFTT